MAFSVRESNSVHAIRERLQCADREQSSVLPGSTGSCLLASPLEINSPTAAARPRSHGHAPPRALRCSCQPAVARAPGGAIVFGWTTIRPEWAGRFPQRYAPSTPYTGGLGAQRTKASAYCRPHSMPRQRLQAV